MNDELAIKIGRHILKQYNKWTENPMGNKIIIPIKLPHISNQPDWNMNIECDMPWFIETYWENGEIKQKHWSFKEWHEVKNTADNEAKKE